VIAEPPLFAGATKEIVACPFPVTAVIEIGAFGIVAGVIADDAVEVTLLPTPLIATTLNV
jgi:hypothetical protein